MRAAVGGSRERGMVAAVSYEARKVGVHSAMPSVTAKRKCPELIFVKPRFDVSKAVSLQIHEIFAEHTPLIEPLSLDRPIWTSPTISRILLGPLAYHALPAAAFGEAGPYYYWIARGVDKRPVRPNRVRKSAGAENTFATDLLTLEAAQEALDPLIAKVWRCCEDSGIRSRTVTLKVKYADFSQATRSRTGLAPVASRGELEQVTITLLEPLFPGPRGIRLLGVTLSLLDEGQIETNAQLQLSL